MATSKTAPEREPAFFERLAALLDLERLAESERMAALSRDLSLVERAARGYAIIDLVIVDENFGLGGRLLLHLQREGGARIEGRFDIGDLVSLRTRRAEASTALSGIVARRSARELVLALDEPPPPSLQSGRLVLELCANDATYRRTKDAVAEVCKLADASGAPRKRVDVLLGRAVPRHAPLDVASDSAPQLEPTLNEEQRLAVERALAAQDFYLVHGPPGTGKSTVLAEIAVQAVRRGARVLVAAASNAAVDHLLELTAGRGLRVLRIGHPARVAERLAQYTLVEQLAAHPDREFAAELTAEAYAMRGYARKQRSRGRSTERFAQARQASSDARALLTEARELERRAVADILDRSEVVCSTLAGLASTELKPLPFDLALIDEATQATEPLTLLAFLRARKLVLAGDHQQLPPTILSQAAQAGGLAVSLFERLLADHGDAIELKQMLCEQHRMHATIMDFPSQAFYGERLRAHPAAAERTLAELLTNRELDAPPLLLIDTAGKGWDAEVAPGTDSYHNLGEAELLVERLRALLSAGLMPEQIGIIAPYSAQVALLRDKVAAQLGTTLLDSIEIDSVDAFQGREKEAILLSLTRSGAPGQIGFLSDLRRINVAITRARRHLLIIGDSATLCAHPFYERLFSYAQTKAAYVSAWELT
jgi:superfamily I DNA and/or RNA helicase